MFMNMLRCPSIAGFRFSNMNIWNSIFSSLHPYVESNQPLFRALSPHAPLLWDCRCGSRTSCVAPIVCFVCERLSFGAKRWAESFSSWRWFGGFGEGLFATCCFLKFFKEEKSPTHCFFRAETYVLKKQSHSGMSMGKFWEATAILEKLLLYKNIWWDVSIFSNTIRFGHYSCFFF